MSNKKQTIVSFCGFIFMLLSVTACAEKGPEQNTSTIPVTVSSGMQLGSLLNEVMASFKVNDIKAMLNKDWYSAVNVKSLKQANATYSIKSCAEYFKLADKALTTVKENENSAFSEFVLMCQAAKVIVEAKQSKRTFLNDFVLDKNLPNKLPKQMALVVSSAESKKINDNSKLVNWSDVNKITKVDVINEFKAKYHQQGSAQEIELVAKGDFDGDGIEDVLVLSRDSVEGGSYNALRMFYFTKRSKEGAYAMGKEFSY